MVFLVVMYGCESRTIKKVECQRIDAFKLWCWRQLLQVPWWRTGKTGVLQSMGSRRSDMTEQLHFHFSLSCIREGNGNPLQCSCLESPRDGGAWWVAVYGVAQSWTQLKRLSSSSSSSSSILYFKELKIKLWDLSSFISKALYMCWASLCPNFRDYRYEHDFPRLKQCLLSDHAI